MCQRWGAITTNYRPDDNVDDDDDHIGNDDDNVDDDDIVGW